jgi:hypothetical protein
MRSCGPLADRGRASCAPQLVGSDLRPGEPPLHGCRHPGPRQPPSTQAFLRGPHAGDADPAPPRRSGGTGRRHGRLSPVGRRSASAGSAIARPFQPPRPRSISITSPRVPIPSMRRSKSCWHSYRAIFHHDRCSTQRTQGQLRGLGDCARGRSMVADQHAALHDRSAIRRRVARRFHQLAARVAWRSPLPGPVHAGRPARPHHGAFVDQDIRQRSCRASLPILPGQATGSTALQTFAPVISMDSRHGSRAGQVAGARADLCRQDRFRPSPHRVPINRVLIDPGLRERLRYVSSHPHVRSAAARCLQSVSRPPAPRRGTRRPCRHRGALACRPAVRRSSEIEAATQSPYCHRSTRGAVAIAMPSGRRCTSCAGTANMPAPDLNISLHAAHYLTAADIVPLLVLLSLETGLELECCKTLTIDCLRNASGGTVEIAYTKLRAHGAEHKTIRVRDGGSTTPGGLIRRIIAHSAKARAHNPAIACGSIISTARSPRYSPSALTDRRLDAAARYCR